MLEIRNLNKTYSSKNGMEHAALKNINLRFEDKGMVFILGKSGSGKSTFLNVVSGLDSYDSGEILICGRSTADFRARDFDSYRNTYLGFIFQEYNILNEFTVAENIALAMQLQGKKAEDDEVESLLNTVGLVGLRDRKPSELSGGQKQRIAIARALIKDPRIIFGDEPTGNLDSGSGKQVFDLLRELSKTKLVVIVSHDRESAFAYGDRVVEFSDGEIIMDYTKEKDGTFTRTRSVLVNKTEKCTLIRSKLPDKTAWKLAVHNIFQKKLRLAVTVVLIVLACSIFGFTQILANYDSTDTAVQSFRNAEISNVILRQGKTGEYFDNFERSNSPIEASTIETLREKYPATAFNKYYPISGIYISMSGGNYLPTSMNGVVVSDEKSIRQLGYELVGSYPEADTNSVVISDYLLFMCLSKDPKILGLTAFDIQAMMVYMEYGDSADEQAAKAMMSGFIEAIGESGDGSSDALNNLLRLVLDDGKDSERNRRVFNVLWKKLVSNIVSLTDKLNISPKMTFTGVLLTGFQEYVDLLQMTKTEQKKDARTVEFSHLFSQYYCVLYTTQTFVEQWYSGSVSNGGAVINKRFTAGKDILTNVNVTYNAAWLAKHPDKNLGANEIVISKTFFQDIYGGLAEFEANGEGDAYDATKSAYKYKYSFTPYNSWQRYYGNTFNLKVVGVYDAAEAGAQNRDKDPNNNVIIPSSARYMVADEKVLNETVRTLKQVGGLYTHLPDGDGDAKDLLSYSCDSTKSGMKLYHYSCISDVLYTMDDTLFIFQTVFKYLSYIMGAFSVLLLVNFMSSSVTNKKRDIGVLRALGARGVDVAKMFIAEATMIGVTTTALSCAGMTGMTYLVNYVLKQSVLKIVQNDMVEKMALLTLSLSPYLIVAGVGLALVYLATVIPTAKISRMLPVNAIKS